MAQAIIRSLAVNAARGNQRAQRLFAELLASVETANKQLYDQWLETAITYKVEWERELRRRKELGIAAPEPIPHPDDIIIDMKTGLVRIAGPMTKEEKAIWDKFRERKKDCDHSIAELKELLRKEPHYSYRNSSTRNWSTNAKSEQSSPERYRIKTQTLLLARPLLCGRESAMGAGRLAVESKEVVHPS